MGLAPYGDPKKYFNVIMEMVHLKEDGIFTIPALYKNATFEEKETYQGTIAYLENIFGVARTPESTITQNHMDIAAALQNVLQATLMHVLYYFKNQTQQKNLCLAGGVALNCSANGYIRKSQLFKEIFVQPASGDDGTALGAALAVSYQHQQKINSVKMPFLGPSYTTQEIENLLKAYPQYMIQRYDDFNSLSREVAKHLAAGKVLGCFQGRMELGPRALGNRSILADPRDPTMRDKINSLVKKRESFRPFAPAVIAEAASTYFDILPGEEAIYRHMLLTTKVKQAFIDKLPAITHVDGSARVQTVIKDQCPNFWTLINEFGKITGLSVLLNTSLNVRGQPIVCSPQEAMETFELAHLDGMILENFLVIRDNKHIKNPMDDNTIC
jgi:carbamoyltransferase